MPWPSRRRAGGIPRHLCRFLHTVGETWCEGKKKGFCRISSRLILDSRVVMGQVDRNSLFLQAFHEGRGQCGIFEKSRFISSAYVLCRVCKTPESNMSPGENGVHRQAHCCRARRCSMRPAGAAERGTWRGAGSSSAGRRGRQKRPAHRRKTWTPFAGRGVATTAAAADGPTARQRSRARAPAHVGGPRCQPPLQPWALTAWQTTSSGALMLAGSRTGSWSPHRERWGHALVRWVLGPCVRCSVCVRGRHGGLH